MFLFTFQDFSINLAETSLFWDSLVDLMEAQIVREVLQYSKATSHVEDLLRKDTQRRALLNNAQLFKSILVQQLTIEANNSKELQNTSSFKQDLSKIQHEKKLLENKISLLTSEIETWKKKSANQTALQKENLTLKNQISKLNSQLNESRNEVGKVKQQFVTQKAVLESKLENAKKSIKSLKDNKPASPTKPAIPSLVSPVKLTKGNQSTNVLLKKPLVSTFSVSPFLHKAIKPTEVSTPTTTTKNILAQSTPGSVAASPSKAFASKTQRAPSGLKNLLSPEKVVAQPKKKTTSLFDVDEDEDEDLFSSSIRKVKKADVSIEKPNKATKSILNPAVKKRKRKLGGKTIVEEEDVDEEINVHKLSPLKRVKLLDKIGGISPLKQRNKERNLFKV